MTRIAVLASGGGSNLQSILDHFVSLGANAPGQIVLVASDQEKAGALDRARQATIEAVALRHARDPKSSELLDLLTARRIELVVLAGYLRLIPSSVVAAYAGRIVNVHPALLPKFGGAGMYGRRVHQAVIDAGEKVSGATIHLVTDDYDRGPILAQWPVAVLPTDDAHTLAARVLVAEHTLYPRVVARLAAGDQSRFPLRPTAGYFAAPPISESDVKRDIIRELTASG